MRYGLPKFSDFLEPFVRDQVASALAHMSFETQKTSRGHISLKTWLIQIFEVFPSTHDNKQVGALSNSEEVALGNHGDSSCC